MLPRALDVIRRSSLLLPDFLTPTSVLITVILFQYYRCTVYGGRASMTPNTAALIHFGANFPPAVWRGDWWRVSASILLHGGVMHIAFNLLALKQICPAIEELFGKGRTLFFFMITGILAAVGSAALRSGGVGIGASGAIMGLVGLAAGWGQRDGGLAGRTTRDSMVNWGLYTMVFGYLVGADNVAHFVGFAAGFAIGYIVQPARRKGISAHTELLESGLGVILFVSTVALTNFPPKSVLDITIATATGAKVLACGDLGDIKEDPSTPSIPTDRSTACKPVVARLGESFGMLVIVEGTPPDGTAYLTVRLLHPPIINPEQRTTNSVDSWESKFEVGKPGYALWSFDYPWEIVPGEWTMQLLADEDGEVLAERKVTVEK